VWREGGPVLVPILDAPAIQCRWPLFGSRHIRPGCRACPHRPCSPGTEWSTLKENTRSTPTRVRSDAALGCVGYRSGPWRRMACQRGERRCFRYGADDDHRGHTYHGFGHTGRASRTGRTSQFGDSSTDDTATDGRPSAPRHYPTRAPSWLTPANSRRRARRGGTGNCARPAEAWTARCSSLPKGNADRPAPDAKHKPRSFAGPARFSRSAAPTPSSSESPTASGADCPELSETSSPGTDRDLRYVHRSCCGGNSLDHLWNGEGTHADEPADFTT